MGTFPEPCWHLPTAILGPTDVSLQLHVHRVGVKKGFSQKLWQVGSSVTEQGLTLHLCQKPVGNPVEWASHEGTQEMLGQDRGRWQNCRPKAGGGCSCACLTVNSWVFRIWRCRQWGSVVLGIHLLLPTLTTANLLEGIDIDRTELSDNKFIKILMIISFSVYYLAKSLQVFLLVGTAIHLGLALKFYLSILFSVSSFFFSFFFRDLICLPAFSDQHLSCVSH